MHSCTISLKYIYTEDHQIYKVKNIILFTNIIIIEYKKNKNILNFFLNNIL